MSAILCTFVPNYWLNMKRILYTVAIAALVLLLTAAGKSRPTTIFIIGDSTAANKDISNILQFYNDQQIANVSAEQMRQLRDTLFSIE